jgi:hypothetical protein
MQARTYLILLLVLTLLGFAAAASFNYVVDPYRFFDTADRPGINEYRHKFFFGQYVAKPYALRKQAPEAVILGVSRAGSSLATDHPGWAGTHVYNYAMAGSTAYLIWRNYQHARASGDLRKVVLMLDFYMFNTYKEQRPRVGHVQVYEERLSATPEFTRNHGYPVRLFKDTLTSLISFEMLYESWNTVLAQGQIAAGDLYKATLTPSGFWINDPAPHRSQRRVFRQIEKQYMTITWFPRPEKKFAMRRDDGSDNLVYLQRIIADAHRQGIDLRLGFMPFHARLAEAMRAVDIWDDFEQWKRDIVALVEAEARAAGQPAFPLWDFTGYNSVNTEPVPSKQDTSTRMRWHLDPSHVSRAAGDLVQTVMLETRGHRVEDFGRQVDSTTLEAYIQSSRVQREHYAERFPDDIEEVLQRARQTSDWRRAATPGT